MIRTLPLTNLIGSSIPSLIYITNCLPGSIVYFGLLFIERNPGNSRYSILSTHVLKTYVPHLYGMEIQLPFKVPLSHNRTILLQGKDLKSLIITYF